MAFTVGDFTDLLHLLEEHPEWRTELRRHVLSDELLELPEIVRQLAGRVGQLAGRTDELATHIDQLTARMDQLTARMDQLSTRMDELATRMDELATRMDQLAGQMAIMTDRMGGMSDRLGAIEGDLLEWRFERSRPPTSAPWRVAFGWWTGLIWLTRSMMPSMPAASLRWTGTTCFEQISCYPDELARMEPTLTSWLMSPRASASTMSSEPASGLAPCPGLGSPPCQL